MRVINKPAATLHNLYEMLLVSNNFDLKAGRSESYHVRWGWDVDLFLCSPEKINLGSGVVHVGSLNTGGRGPDSHSKFGPVPTSIYI